MIEIVYTKRFLKSVGNLPRPLNEKLIDRLNVLSRNPFDPRLRTKFLAGELSGLYSFRITRDYRILFRFADPVTIELIRAAHRKDIYR